MPDDHPTAQARWAALLDQFDARLTAQGDMIAQAESGRTLDADAVLGAAGFAAPSDLPALPAELAPHVERLARRAADLERRLHAVLAHRPQDRRVPRRAGRALASSIDMRA